MKILHVWGDYFPSLFDETHSYCLTQKGVESHLLAERLVETGAPVPNHVYSIRRTRAEDAFPERLGAKFARVVFGRLRWRRFNSFCATHAEEMGNPILHFHFGTTAARMLPLLRQKRRRAVVSFYGVDASAALNDPFWGALYPEMFERVSVVMVLCEAVRERLLKAGCPSQKIRIWDMPAGTEKYPYHRRERRGPVRILIAARFVEKKGYPYLLEAFERLLREGHDLRLSMIGYGPMKAELERRIAAPLYAGRAQLVDTQIKSSFETLYREALESHDVFVLPSTTAANGDDEGGPALTMVCAQAAGLPVICTPFAGAERSLIDGQTGIYCEQDDIESLVSKMRWCIENPEEWNRLGSAASELVRKNFSREGQMQAQLAIYRGLELS